MKWIFALDHCHYGLWGTVHLSGLIKLHDTSNVYRDYISGNFAFQKSYLRISKMVVDQVHEQNNEKFERVSGETHLLNCNDMSGMERWETSSPEIARIIENFESHTGQNFDTIEKLHHENIVAFQNRFSLNVKKIIEGMDVNPLLQEDLVKISNVSQVCDHQVHLTLQTLLVNGET